jgi:GIY-YIG catalytic domain
MEDCVLDRLEEDGFVRLPSVDNHNAIYCLVWKGEVVFVGRSKSVYWRFAHHRNDLVRKDGAKNSRFYFTAGSYRKEVPFDDIWILFCEPEDLVRLELKYIDLFRPRYNPVLTPLPNLKVDIKALAAQLNWGGQGPKVESIRRRKL